MTMSISPLAGVRDFGQGCLVRVELRVPSPSPHEFLAAACPEEEGGYSVFALHYPDVISQGETLDEARANIAEAFLAVFESRQKHEEAMVYSAQAVEVPAGCTRMRIRIDG